ncbi:hypothetical protein [Methanosarcina horonobensis]|uniref:hypothetical protein n=1 Tax=Methanosarcina horonobensis TaxID=418008 RepID=UPI00138DF892|nr:hypothetical protein [Methanosarcina horonobensis]
MPDNFYKLYFPEPTRQDNGSEVFPFGILCFGSNIRAVKVTVTEIGKDFKGCIFNFGFRDDGRDGDFSFLFLSFFVFFCSFCICQGSARGGFSSKENFSH